MAITHAEDFAAASAEPGADFLTPAGAPEAAEKAAGRPLFNESPSAFVRRVALGIAYALQPDRLHLVPPVVGQTAEFLISAAAARRRMAEPKPRGWQGLVAVSEDLSATALLDGYRRGLFPFCHVRPMKWWSPDVRAVLRPGESRIEKNVRRIIRQGKYQVTFDTGLAAVMRACAEPRPGKTPLTWITPQVMRAFWNLHQAGHVHSTEVWDGEGRLVGGAYGLAAGRVYFGESQFSLVRDASKIAVATLHCHLDHWGFALRDAKWMTPHLAGQGFHPISRAEFTRELEEHAWQPGRVGRWEVDPSLDIAGWRGGKQ